MDYDVNGKRSLWYIKHLAKKHLTPFFGGWRMVDITTADVNQYIAQRQAAGAANSQINRELALLKRSFNLAIQAGKLRDKPLATAVEPGRKPANA